MFKIGSIPHILKAFFRHLRPFFQARQWPHFWGLVIAMALSKEHKTISQLHGFLINAPWPQRLVDFLIKSPWNGELVLQRAAMYTLRALGWCPGQPLRIVIDGSKTYKRGKHMEAAHWFFDHVKKGNVFGHQFLLVAINYRGVLIPWAIRLYRPRKYCVETWGRAWKKYFRTFNELTADVILKLPDELLRRDSARALFDSAFLNDVVLKACSKKHLKFVSVAKSNRIFFPEHQKGRPKDNKARNRRIVGSYGPGILRYSGEEIKLKGSRCDYVYRVAERTGTLQKVGKVKLVFSRRLKDNGFIILATNDFSLTPAQVIQCYQKRWSIEIFFKEAKQCLGLGDYQVLSEAGVEHHLHLSAIAYLLLKHLGQRFLGEEKKGTTDIALSSIGSLQNRLQTLVAQNHLERITGKYGLNTALRQVLGCMKLEVFPVT